ncbi:MAG: hypothetical protein HGN29_10580 [Asgard group archaeon]|nr:hypothetical protein [Asgard group archaeon]
MIYLLLEDMERIIDKIENNGDLISVEKNLRLLASNYRTLQVSELIDKTIEKCKFLDNKKILVDLYGHKILILYNFGDKIQTVSKLVDEMISISKKINYKEGLAWAYSYVWYIEKLKGNVESSIKALEKSNRILANIIHYDEYIYNFVKYSSAMEKWLKEHDASISESLEVSANYFFNNGFHRSFAQTIGFLSIVFMRTQETKKGLRLLKNILSNRLIFENMPHDVKSIIYFFAGLVHLLDQNLYYSELFLTESYNYMKHTYKESIYFSNYIVMNSFLSTVTALQGRLEQALDIIKEVDDLLKQEFFDKNLDFGTKKQIYHTLNLNKFYVYSRLKNFDSEEMLDLIEKIFMGCKTLYSDFMLLSEFILNANLESGKMEELLSLENYSLNRIKHIILFVLQKNIRKEESNDWRYLQRIKILNNREKTKKTTFIENVFADLLIAQQLFSLKRYEEIYSLLRKYETQLHRIEVLELCIFMEAFIQVGAFKSGNPLGPALQYMAIKKCRNYGFSRLESKLLYYLDKQHRDIQLLIV